MKKIKGIIQILGMMIVLGACSEAKQEFPITEDQPELPIIESKDEDISSTTENEVSVPKSLQKIDFAQNYLEGETVIDLSQVIDQEIHNVLGVYEDNLYYISYKDIGLEVICVENFLSEAPNSYVLYECTEGTIWYYEKLYKNKIYIEVTSDGLYSKMLEISMDGKVREIYSEEDAIWRPIIYDVPGYIVLTYQKENQCVLECISMEEGNEQKTIATTELTAPDEEGRMTGEYISHGGSCDGDGFYYEVITLQNEILSEGTKVTIYYYDFQEEKINYVVEPGDKSIYLCGSSHYLFRSVYASTMPKSVSGKVYWKDDEREYSFGIVGFSSGNDMNQLFQYGENTFIGVSFYNIEIIDVSNFTRAEYFFDMEGDVYTQMMGFSLVGNELHFLLVSEKTVLYYTVSIHETV